MNDQWRWAAAPVVQTTDRFHGYTIQLDLADYFQRVAYFFGCYHERHIIAALREGLRAGDAFIDAGANTGLLTLHAAGLVGRSGRVDAFEPCEAVLRELQWHVATNELSQVNVHPIAISDREETLELRVPGFDNMGAGTLGPLPQRYGGDYHDACPARTIRLDDSPASSDDRPLFIKMDVEGFELRALRGAMETIKRRHPAILMETNEEMLEMNGATAADLDAELRPLGYQALALDRRGWRHGYQLHLHPLQPHQIGLELDVLWLTPEGPHWPRFANAIQPVGRYWRHRRAKK